MPTIFALPTSTLLTSAPQKIRWNRLVLILTAAMGVLAAGAAVGRFVGTVEIAGLNQWDKPRKVALPIAPSSVTWSWWIGQLQRFEGTASIAGSVISRYVA